MLRFYKLQNMLHYDRSLCERVRRQQDRQCEKVQKKKKDKRGISQIIKKVHGTNKSMPPCSIHTDFLVNC